MSSLLSKANNTVDISERVNILTSLWNNHRSEFQYKNDLVQDVTHLLEQSHFKLEQPNPKFDVPIGLILLETNEVRGGELLPSYHNKYTGSRTFNTYTTLPQSTNRFYSNKMLSFPSVNPNTTEKEFKIITGIHQKMEKEEKEENMEDLDSADHFYFALISSQHPVQVFTQRLRGVQSSDSIGTKYFPASTPDGLLSALLEKSPDIDLQDENETAGLYASIPFLKRDKLPFIEMHYIDGYLADNGGETRKFVVFDTEEQFLRFFFSIPWRQRVFHEHIRSRRKIKPFFDIEATHIQFPRVVEREGQLIHVLVEHITNFLRLATNDDGTHINESCVCISSATTNKKLSLHVTIESCYYFTSVARCRRFAECLLCYLDRYLVGSDRKLVFLENETKSVFDMAVYNDSKSMRMIGCSKKPLLYETDVVESRPLVPVRTNSQQDDPKMSVYGMPYHAYLITVGNFTTEYDDALMAEYFTDEQVQRALTKFGSGKRTGLVDSTDEGTGEGDAKGILAKVQNLYNIPKNSRNPPMDLNQGWFENASVLSKNSMYPPRENSSVWSEDSEDSKDPPKKAPGYTFMAELLMKMKKGPAVKTVEEDVRARDQYEEDGLDNSEDAEMGEDWMQITEEEKEEEENEPEAIESSSSESEEEEEEDPDPDRAVCATTNLSDNEDDEDDDDEEDSGFHMVDNTAESRENEGGGGEEQQQQQDDMEYQEEVLGEDEDEDEMDVDMDMEEEKKEEEEEADEEKLSPLQVFMMLARTVAWDVITILHANAVGMKKQSEKWFSRNNIYSVTLTVLVKNHRGKEVSLCCIGDQECSVLREENKSLAICVSVSAEFSVIYRCMKCKGYRVIFPGGIWNHVKYHPHLRKASPQKDTRDTWRNLGMAKNVEITDLRDRFGDGTYDGYIPECPSLLNKKGTGIRKKTLMMIGGMGTGKTHQIKRSLCQVTRKCKDSNSEVKFDPYNPDSVAGNWRECTEEEMPYIRIISCRKLFAMELYNNFKDVIPGLVNYLKSRKKSLYSEKAVICSLESFPRLAMDVIDEEDENALAQYNFIHPDILILDEVTSLLENLLGDTVSKSFGLVVDSFMTMIRLSRCVIMSDADLAASSFHLCNILRRRCPKQIIDNPTVKIESTYYDYASFGTWLEKFEDTIDRGKNIFFLSNNLRMMEAILLYIDNHYKKKLSGCLSDLVYTFLGYTIGNTTENERTTKKFVESYIILLIFLRDSVHAHDPYAWETRNREVFVSTRTEMIDPFLLVKDYYKNREETITQIRARIQGGNTIATRESDVIPSIEFIHDYIEDVKQHLRDMYDGGEDKDINSGQRAIDIFWSILYLEVPRIFPSSIMGPLYEVKIKEAMNIFTVLLNTEVISARTEERKKNYLLTNVSITWKGIRIFACTPAIGPGIDFSPLYPHFTHIFIYLRHDSANGRYAMQMHGRNRNTGINSETHIYFEDPPTSKNDLYDGVCYNLEDGEEEGDSTASFSEKIKAKRKEVKRDIGKRSGTYKSTTRNRVSAFSVSIHDGMKVLMNEYSSSRARCALDIRGDTIYHIFKHNPAAEYYFDIHPHSKEDHQLLQKFRNKYTMELRLKYEEALMNSFTPDIENPDDIRVLMERAKCREDVSRFPTVQDAEMKYSDMNYENLGFVQKRVECMKFFGLSDLSLHNYTRNHPGVKPKIGEFVILDEMYYNRVQEGARMFFMTRDELKSIDSQRGNPGEVIIRENHPPAEACHSTGHQRYIKLVDRQRILFGILYIAGLGGDWENGSSNEPYCPYKVGIVSDMVFSKEPWKVFRMLRTRPFHSKLSLLRLSCTYTQKWIRKNIDKLYAWMYGLNGTNMSSVLLKEMSEATGRYERKREIRKFRGLSNLIRAIASKLLGILLGTGIRSGGYSERTLLCERKEDTYKKFHESLYHTPNPMNHFFESDSLVHFQEEEALLDHEHRPLHNQGLDAVPESGENDVSEDGENDASSSNNENTGEVIGLPYDQKDVYMHLFWGVYRMKKEKDGEFRECVGYHSNDCASALVGEAGVIGNERETNHRCAMHYVNPLDLDRFFEVLFYAVNGGENNATNNITLLEQSQDEYLCHQGIERLLTDPLFGGTTIWYRPPFMCFELRKHKVLPWKPDEGDAEPFSFSQLETCREETNGDVLNLISMGDRCWELHLWRPFWCSANSIPYSKQQLLVSSLSSNDISHKKIENAKTSRNMDISRFSIPRVSDMNEEVYLELVTSIGFMEYMMKNISKFAREIHTKREINKQNSVGSYMQMREALKMGLANTKHPDLNLLKGDPYDYPEIWKGQIRDQPRVIVYPMGTGP